MTEYKLLIVPRSRKPLVAPLIPFRLVDLLSSVAKSEVNFVLIESWQRNV
jgi:hypothetical protein